MLCLEYAINSLIRKRQTERQIREKIKQRFPDADFDSIIARLKELNYLNDQEFAEAYVRYRSSHSPRGNFLIKQELKKKGIRTEFIEKALKPYDQEQALKTLAEDRWKKIREGDMKKRREKLIRYLLSRGFSLSSIIQTVNSFAQKEDG